MKRQLLMLCVALFAVASAVAQEKPNTVVFYNLENLFDIYDDPETHDEEFTPDGAKQWNEIKYRRNSRIWSVFSSILPLYRRIIPLL